MKSLSSFVASILFCLFFFVSIYHSMAAEQPVFDGGESNVVRKNRHLNLEEIDVRDLPYNDDTRNNEERFAVALLTSEKIVQGNPDGTFGYDDLLNRAAFLKIVMGLETRKIDELSEKCFYDVPVDAWYFQSVCAAKQLGYISGNEIKGTPQNQWPFEPERPVQYEEALKILTEIYSIKTLAEENEPWYQRYVRYAETKGIAPATFSPGAPLRRGAMALLTARFIADNEKKLPDYLSRAAINADDLHKNEEAMNAEKHYYTDELMGTVKYFTIDGRPESGWIFPTGGDGYPISNDREWNQCIREEALKPELRTKEHCSQYKYKRNTWVHPDLNAHFIWNASSNQISDVKFQETPNQGVLENATVTLEFNNRNRFIVPGEEVMLAKFIAIHKSRSSVSSTEIFHELIPQNFLVELYEGSSALDSLHLLDENGELYGTKEGGGKKQQFAISGKVGRITYGTQLGFYVRGTVSGDAKDALIQVNRVSVTADKKWTEFTGSETIHSDEVFPIFQVARSYISKIDSVDAPDTSIKFRDPDQLLGTFTFTNQLANGGTVILENINFSYTTTTQKPKDVRIRNDQSGEIFECEVGKSSIECSDLPESVGTMYQQSVSYSLYGTLEGEAQKQHSFQLIIDSLGTPRKPGSLLWSDGFYDYQWVDTGDGGSVSGSVFSGKAQ